MSTELTKSNDEQIAKLKEMSGEANQESREFTPIIQVNNSKVEKEVDGEMVEVLGKKEYKIVSKEGDEYKTEPFATTFDAIILKVRYVVQKKYVPNDTTPNWRSYEFDNFNEKISLISEGNLFYEGTYQQIKKEFEGKTSLSAIVYVMANGKVYKLNLKGGSMSALWDYLKTFGYNDSSSAHLTTFGLKKEKGAGFSYHVATMEVAKEDVVNLDEVLAAQAEIVELLNSFRKEKDEAMPLQGKVVDDEDIIIDFND